MLKRLRLSPPRSSSMQAPRFQRTWRRGSAGLLLSGLVAGLLLALMATKLPGASASDPVQVGDSDFVVTGTGPTYDFQAETTSFSYFLEDADPASGPDLSHWVLGMCTSPLQTIVSFSPTEGFEDLRLNGDPTTELQGVKWELAGGFVSGTFTITVAGLWQGGTSSVVVATKAARDVDTGYVEGISCDAFEPDEDNDGCPDAAELGPNPVLGGARDPLNPYDFYDVPVPSLHDGGTMSSRDMAVSVLKDVLAVLKYAGKAQSCPGDTPTPDGATTCGLTANGAACCHDAAGVDYDEDINGDTVADGLAYDRSAGALWSDAPNGALSILEDVLLVVAQAGHVCVVPP